EKQPFCWAAFHWDDVDHDGGGLGLERPLDRVRQRLARAARRSVISELEQVNPVSRLARNGAFEESGIKMDPSSHGSRQARGGGAFCRARGAGLRLASLGPPVS